MSTKLEGARRVIVRRIRTVDVITEQPRLNTHLPEEFLHPPLVEEGMHEALICVSEGGSSPIGN